MDNEYVGSNDFLPSIKVSSVLNQIKRFTSSNKRSFETIIKYSFINEIIRNDEFKLLIDEKLERKLEFYLFRIRGRDEIIICEELGDKDVYIGNIYTGENSTSMVEFEKLKGIINLMVDYKPFNYREIFLNALNYGNRN